LNKDTLESLIKQGENLRSGIVRDDYDIRQTLTYLLSVVIEEMKYESTNKDRKAEALYQ